MCIIWVAKGWGVVGKGGALGVGFRVSLPKQGGATAAITARAWTLWFSPESSTPSDQLCQSLAAMVICR